MDKPNCYQCKYRRGLSGDCHSQCVHPRRPGLPEVLVILGGLIGSQEVKEVLENPIKVTANQHGIDRGWFMWPVNFDPVWLETCTGFEEANNG